MSATCSVPVGDNPLEFAWYFNGQPINPHDKEDIIISINKRRSSLDIESVHEGHSGEYTCTVSNQAGGTSHSTALIVNGNNIVATKFECLDIYFNVPDHK